MAQNASVDPSDPAAYWRDSLRRRLILLALWFIARQPEFRRMPAHA